MASLSTEQGSGRGIQERLGCLGLVARPSSLPPNLSLTGGDSNHRPVCLQNLSSASTLHGLEGGSRRIGGECPSPGLDRQSSLCLPSFSADRESPSEAEGPRNRLGLSLSHLALAALVVEGPRDVNKTPSQTSFQERPSVQPKGGNTSSSCTGNEPSTSSSLVALRKRLQADNLSEESFQLISNSRRPSTRANYDGAWSRFSGWCSKRGADPVRCPLSTVLDYLSELHHEGASMGLIGTHRSAISAFHEKIDGVSVGKCENTSLLLRGIGNSKPVAHKYVPVWDVSKVLDYMASRSNPDLKFLSQKLVTLLAITSFHRGMELHSLSLDLMSRFDDRECNSIPL